jgi:hypothetical protein
VCVGELGSLCSRRAAVRAPSRGAGQRCSARTGLGDDGRSDWPGLGHRCAERGSGQRTPGGARASWRRQCKQRGCRSERARDDGHADVDGNGYTELEEYLQWMAAPHFFTTMTEPIAVDLAQAFAGYTESPSYSASDAQISGAKAAFTPSACGFASFELKVTDAAGATMNKPFGVFVKCP